MEKFDNSSFVILEEESLFEIDGGIFVPPLVIVGVAALAFVGAGAGAYWIARKFG